MTKRDSNELEADTSIGEGKPKFLDLKETDVQFIPAPDPANRTWTLAYGDYKVDYAPVENTQTIDDFYNATPVIFCYWYKDTDGKEHSLRIPSNCDTRMLGGVMINENLSTKYNMIRVRDDMEICGMPSNEVIKDKILIVRPSVGRFIKSKGKGDLSCARVVSASMEDDDYHRLTFSAGISKFHVWV